MQVFENTELMQLVYFHFLREAQLSLSVYLYLSLTHAHHFRHFMLFTQSSALISDTESLLFALFDVLWKQKLCDESKSITTNSKLT